MFGLIEDLPIIDLKKRLIISKEFDILTES